MTLRNAISHFRSSKHFVLFTICTAMFTDGFIYGIVAPVLPFVLKDEKLVDEDHVQISTSLLIAAFSLADFFGAPLCAWYIDRSRSRRIPWFVGIALITAGTVLLGAAKQLWMLILSRVLQGLSSSILYTVGLAVLVDTVEKSEVGQWMGTAMSCNNIGIIVSPLLGGVVYDKGGKMIVFAIMMALGGIDIILRVLMKEPGKNCPQIIMVRPPEEAAHNEKRVGDKVISIPDSSAVSNVSQLSIAQSTGLSHHETNPEASILGGPALHAAPSRSSTSRRLPGVIALLKSPRLLAALYGCFINECIVASLCAVLPLFVNETFNWRSLQAGPLFLTIAIPAFAGPLAGALSDRVGARWVAVAGFLATTPLLILLRLVDHDSKDKIVLLCGLLTLAGCTIIFFLSPLGAECSFVADELSLSQNCDMYASSFSLMNCSLAAAGLLGPLAAGGLQQNFGWKTTTAALGALCASGALPCALVTGRKRSSYTEGIV